ncbi:4-alpha-glucanotransferase [Aldersonia sp. NBC_00410]|uniref:4-alpha-glucanotransferase n=1 Tax=Aldersonia sp. NBC_00410 TaxID=2975954 RepID=UPI0022547F42|nr:4-alpha-glucanotransferase [Aldersonia sp. NBC_00410]MCX5046455.1 4-alpha-glucanotransferase [Aldersonia sp. NBC_00410]
MTNLDQLRALAARHGVATAYDGWDHVRRDVSAATLRAVLGALGVPAEDDEQVSAALVEADIAPWRRLLPAAVVTVEAREREFVVHVPHGTPVEVWIRTEDGSRRAARQLDVWVDPREVDGVLVGRATFAVPSDIEPGWHTLHAEIAGGPYAECALVVTPARLTRSAALTDRQRWGLALQLYSIRSARSWGVGDFGDLADIATTVGSVHGGDYVLVNPIHAAEPVLPLEESPYLPTTRRFVNPLYIRVRDIAETAELRPKDYARIAEFEERAVKRNRDPKRIDRNRTFRAKLRALRLVHRVPRSAHRQAAFEQFCRVGGQSLDDYALWCALTEKHGSDDPRWDGEFAHPGTDAVEVQRRRLGDRIEFHKWLQWICDEQLAAAHRAALDAGMAIGVMHDLAVGVQRKGADAWALGDAVVRGATVGAPPDDFNQQGQQWNQPPWHPERLAEQGYAPYREMLRGILRHAGGIRVDHIIGLFRLWWIPDGESPAAGTYVRYDHEALIGILVLEAERAGAVVVGEDLGVFEPTVQDYLYERGVLGTSILWFEHGEYAPIPPEEYRQLCLTSVTTHDLPPTAGYLAGEHIDLRDRLGLLERDVAVERAEDARDRDAVLELARTRGLLVPEANVAEQVDAVHRLIARSPSVLLGMALVDAVGERRIQNQPGTDQRQYPNWCIPLADRKGRVVMVEDLSGNERFAALVRAFGDG